MKIVLSLTRKMNDADRESARQMQRKGLLLTMLPNSDSQKLLSELKGASNPTVALYGWAESVAPQAFDLGRMRK